MVIACPKIPILPFIEQPIRITVNHKSKPLNSKYQKHENKPEIALSAGSGQMGKTCNVFSHFADSVFRIGYCSDNTGLRKSH